MRHIVNVSIAPVVVVMDDRADPVQMFAAPMSVAFWLPCWLYVWLAGLPGRIAPARAGWAVYRAGWAADLALMAEAAALALRGRLVFLESTPSPER